MENPADAAGATRAVARKSVQVGIRGTGRRLHRSGARRARHRNHPARSTSSCWRPFVHAHCPRGTGTAYVIAAPSTRIMLDSPMSPVRARFQKINSIILSPLKRHSTVIIGDKGGSAGPMCVYFLRLFYDPTTRAAGFTTF